MSKGKKDSYTRTLSIASFVHLAFNNSKMNYKKYFHTKDTFHIKTNFLEYGSFCIKIKSFLKYKDFPMYKTSPPRNSYLNIIVHKDTKGVSNLYRSLHVSHYNIVEENCNQWNACDDIALTPIEISKSFKRHSTLVNDTYAKYVQFKTIQPAICVIQKLKEIPICLFIVKNPKYCGRILKDG